MFGPWNTAVVLSDDPRSTLRDARSAKLDLMRPGKPVENAFAESFIGSLRGEHLDEDWFLSLRQSRETRWPGGGTATKSPLRLIERRLAAGVC